MAEQQALPQFELVRKRLEREGAKQQQQQQEAIQRRFAAAGGLSSGAQIKAQNVARQELAGQQQARLEQIGLAEAIQKLRKFGAIDSEIRNSFNAIMKN